jgi:hypothetical protein
VNICTSGSAMLGSCPGQASSVRSKGGMNWFVNYFMTGNQTLFEMKNNDVASWNDENDWVLGGKDNDKVLSEKNGI